MSARKSARTVEVARGVHWLPLRGANAYFVHSGESWVLIDAGDVIVHLFRPEVRSFYNLERMWAFGDAPPPGPDSSPAAPTPDA